MLYNGTGDALNVSNFFIMPEKCTLLSVNNATSINELSTYLNAAMLSVLDINNIYIVKYEKDMPDVLLYYQECTGVLIDVLLASKASGGNCVTIIKKDIHCQKNSIFEYIVVILLIGIIFAIVCSRLLTMK